ncbi:uncharacterized protein N7469_004744 [Penicillium citrinum]|uniref:Uncharacterized protein n=2 Tax=Penicillium TaxID=5073 RepID=A0A9W9P509_PENCI|nr:uncharacterized protein N7469_004744 [Penicillium citrinum]KAJ5235576.1 hypothetical protein N7469_004744 [Penicillium citrinum]KAJ5591139.1 hypothetical protein N7450_005111 [Penicillium hetheringtonii]
MTMSQPASAEKTIRKIDIAQVSLSLQDRLGLAKLKYQHGRLHGLNSISPFDSDKPSDSSSDFSRSRCETPFTSPPLEAATYSKELPRSARNRHAVTFNSRVMQPMLSASRKRLRSDSGAERPAKAPRVSWKSSYQLPESSPGLSRHLTSRRTQHPFMSEAPIPEMSSPVYHGPSDEENDPDLPLHSFQNVSSMVGSSPPRTPPPKHARLSRNDRTTQHEDGADLLLYLANSPTPARVAGGSQHQAFPPSTPPSQHAVLPSLTPNLGTPGQQFNFADFVNVTPSPAQPAWGGRTPGNPGRTPLSTKDARKRLNFDALVPPSAPSPRLRKDAGLALQLGGELRL